MLMPGIIPNHFSTLFIETGVLVKLTDVARHMRSGDTISTSAARITSDHWATTPCDIYIRAGDPDASLH